MFHLNSVVRNIRIINIRTENTYTIYSHKITLVISDDISKADKSMTQKHFPQELWSLHSITFEYTLFHEYTSQ